ncbi:DUF4043 family protein [Campylobacter jejuni]|nr:DUF4043 family protein [Campylobacter jejuni]ECP8538592.1 DUF4043 family protein [Campylobacter jejuni]ECP8719614.1 DUF4043 family protein [Campylobacter jejuni]ECP8882297.1 DUF4043 family protein [Campylobacter jejuni]ECP9441151.1 DUF4043 family protein [Campylobacter jejuni]
MPLNISDERLSRWAEDPLVSVDIANEIEKGYFRDNRFLILAGQKKSRGIITRVLTDLSPYREKMKTGLTGKGVTGNTNFDANRDSLNFLTYQIEPVLKANSIQSENLVYEKTRGIDFIREATDSLQDWMNDLVQKMMSATLVNNFTNVVLADGANGYKAAATKETKVTDYAKTNLKKGDVLSVKTIKRAISMAKNGQTYDGTPGFVVKPLEVKVMNEGGFEYKDEVYVLFINSLQAEQLKNDPEWKECQKMDKRGDTNRLFTGSIGAIENCIVIEMSEWLNDNVIGLPSSDFNQGDFEEYVQNATPMELENYKGTNTHSCIGVLIGAGALAFGSNVRPEVYINDEDSKRKVSVGIDKIIAISKTRYDMFGSYGSIGGAKNSKTSPLNGKDFSVIGILSAKE